MAVLSFARLQSASDFGLQAINVGLSRIVIFLLLLLIFYYSSTLFWKVFYPQEFRLPVSVTKVLVAKPQPKTRWSWFDDTKQVVREKVAPATLNAKLIGVIAPGEGEGEGIALIEVKGKKSSIFKVGDEVIDAVFVDSIGSDYVNLERDGKIEVLQIKKYNIFRDPPEEDVAKEDQRQQSDGEKAVEEFKETVSEEPLKVMEFIQFEAAGGDQEGFKISPKKDEHQNLFDELGLVAGDVVVSANGNDISKLKQNPAKLDKLLKEGVTLQVLRDGILTDVYIY